MRRTPCLLALALGVGVLAGAAPAGASASTSTVTGTVREVVVEHRGQHGPADVRKVLVQDGRTVALPAGALAGHAAGDTVQVVLQTGTGGVASVTRSRVVVRAPARGEGTAAAVAPSTTDRALHEVYLAVVDPQGKGRALTQDAATRATALVRQASDYWSSQTGGQVRFEVAQTLSPYTSAFACGPDSTTLMWNEALDRFDAQSGRRDTAFGVDKHLLVVLPDGAEVDGCAYGLGTIGGLHQASNAVLLSDSNPSLYAHELGHNLGLDHSNALHCDTPDAVPTSTAGYRTSWPSRCHGEEYGDLLDVMGYSGHGFGEGSLNGVHLDQMRLSSSRVRTITGNATTSVPLVPLSATGPGLKTVVVTDSRGTRYSAEYRTRTGRDALTQQLDLGDGPPDLGVRILRTDPARPAGSYVLDASPTGPREDYRNALRVGGTFRTVTGTVTFSVTSAGASGATLTVTRAVPPATATASVPARAAAGAAVTATTRLTDARGAGVASWPVTLQVRPKGSTAWVTAATARTGSTGTATFSYTNGTTGTYRVVTKAAAGAPARTSAGAVTTSYATPRLTAPPSTVRAGARVATTGTLKGLPGRQVDLQARLGTGSWATVGRATRDGSTFTASYRPSARGTWQLRYRARADGNGRYEAGYSPVRTVVVQ